MNGVCGEPWLRAAPALKAWLNFEVVVNYGTVGWRMWTRHARMSVVAAAARPTWLVTRLGNERILMLTAIVTQNS
jgi:hypothetical protein